MKKKVSFIFILLLLIITGCSSENDILSSTTSVNFEKLLFEIPSSFKSDEDGNMNFYSWDDFEGERKNSCSLNVSTSPSYDFTDVKESAYENVSYMASSPEDVKISTVTINGNVWIVAEVSTKKAKYSSYVIEKDNLLYNLGYDDIGSGDICGQALDIIVNSLKFN